jgi:hypothetical protein
MTRTTPTTGTAPVVKSAIPLVLEPLVRAYMATFLNRATPYARQRDDGSYRWIVQPSDDPVLSAHLAGKQTVAVASLDEEGRCRWACLDADGDDGLAQLVQVRAYFATHALPGVLEASRRGGHLWLLFAEPVAASVAREVILPLLESLRTDDLPLDRLDLYPDSGRIGALGHAVRLPLGVHRVSGKRYPFLDEQGLPLPLAKLPEALAYLAQAPRIPLEVVEDLHERLAPYLERTRTPSRDDRSEQDVPPAATYSTRSEVMRWVDAHVSPLDLLEEFAPTSELRRVGQGWLGWCPFHDDRAEQEDGSPGTPSLYVVRNDRYGWSWQCLSSNCAHAHGPMRHSFRLFQELLGLDAQAAIRAALDRWPDDAREHPTTDQ